MLDRCRRAGGSACFQAARGSVRSTCEDKEREQAEGEDGKRAVREMRGRGGPQLAHEGKDGGGRMR